MLFISEAIQSAFAPLLKAFWLGLALNSFWGLKTSFPRVHFGLGASNQDQESLKINRLHGGVFSFGGSGWVDVEAFSRLSGFEHVALCWMKIVLPAAVSSHSSTRAGKTEVFKVFVIS